MQSIVFNAHYLMYFDTAVAGYWRALAMPYHDTMAYLGGDLYARKATVEYEASARYDDLIEVGVLTHQNQMFGSAERNRHKRGLGGCVGR